MESLLDKFLEFQRGFYSEHRDIYRNLATGQAPHTLVIACSDSRVLPETLFGAGPGEIFVIRNVANLIPPYAPDENYHGTSAAVEFAVRALKVPRIVVLGHSSCGGVNALLSDGGGAEFDFLGQWVMIGEPALKRVRCSGHTGAAAQKLGELEVVRTSVVNLMSFPWLAERVTAGELQVYGAHFDFETGDLMLLESPEGEFKPVSSESMGKR
jgi:carbonic anhydrase